METNNAYVYLHRRLDTNDVFYVGIGSQKNFRRAYIKTRRNIWWYNIVNKTGYAVDIIYKNISWEQACKYETNLISMYGRKNLGLGNLCNLTDGGDGTFGKRNVVSDITRAKQSKARKGKKFSDSHKLNLSKSLTGKPKNRESVERSNNSKKKLIIDTYTGILYLGIREAANAVGVNKEALKKWLTGVNKNKTNLEYVK